jgi:hypothetical protein
MIGTGAGEVLSLKGLREWRPPRAGSWDLDKEVNLSNVGAHIFKS